MRRLFVRRSFALFVVGVLLSLLAAVAFGDLRGGEDLLIQRKYAEAAAAIEAVLPDLPVQERARGAFLLGHAKLLAGDAKGAIAIFQRLEQEQGQSAYATAGRFLEAKACERSGDLRGAAQAYRAEVEHLVGLQRKEEVAATYLGMAAKALAADPAQHERAVVFFDLAIDLGLSEAKARSVRLQAAESLFAATKAAEAVARLRPLIAELDVANGKLRAMLVLGRALRVLGDRVAARGVLRDLRGLAPTAVEAGDAAYELALCYGVPEPSPADIDRATAALRELANKHPEHPKAKIVDYLIAQCYVHVGRSDDALAAIDAFLKSNGDSGLPEVADARALIGDVLVGQQKFEPAIAAYREYLRLHPAHASWERVQRAIVDAEYALAMVAYEAGPASFGVARERFAAFGAAYPLDARNPTLLYLLGDMLQREKKHDEARLAFARCVSKYPGKQQSSRAQFEIGQIYENDTFNYEAALQAYRAVEGAYAPQAAQALERLLRKSLALRTDRVFRTDEHAVCELVSRNIEKVRVRVYRLELEDYFRAVHTTGDIERLDIEVIAADRTVESAVPDYVKYRETKRDIEIGFDKPGAYVVKVDDQELEATTLVLISDLALISKSSRHEFFVFTQNVREQRAEGGVKVVLSDGNKVLGEGITGADGVYRWQGAALQQAEGLVVFAVDAAGSGASSLDLSALSHSAGLTPKGYLYTDRPLYQPGQRVSCKGIVREVENGTYRLPAAKGYRLRIFTPAGRVSLDREIGFSEFGSFAAELDLPADAELGDWRLQVDRTGSAEHVFHGQFAVQKYERPRLWLAFELEQQVVFRGEPVRGRAVLRHFYGEPAAGKAISVEMAMPDGAKVVQEGVTNAAGELAFEFASTEFREEAIAQLQANVPGEGVSLAGAVPIVTTELTVAASVLRPVYLAGETFAVTAEIRDRSGKPLAREATAVLLKVTPARRSPTGEAEVEEARAAVHTGADGTGIATFHATKGGRYRVRVETTDRFAQRVVGTAELSISGDDDDQKLRLLGDRDSYRTGETAAVKVMNRCGAKLALITWQGDGILGYEARLLPAGESTIQVQLQTLHVPNFALAVAMIDGGELHEAQRDFRVEHDLRLSLSMPQTARPGSEIEVGVLAKDAEGRPVAAEVSLALVDEALWSLATGNAPPIGAFFYGQLRDTSFATASSCTWSYRGTTHRVSEALRVEERLLEETRALRAGVPPANDPQGRENARSQLRDSMGEPPRTGADDFYLGGRLKQAAGIDAGEAWRALSFAQAGEQSTYSGVTALGGTAMQPDQPRRDFRETGVWISAVTTDADGHASVKFNLPHSTTSWRLQGYATTKDTQVGEATANLKTQQELQIDLIGPPVLTEGDEVAMRIAAHNLTDAGVDAKVTWQAKGVMTGDGSAERPLAAHGENEIEVPVLAGVAGDLDLSAHAEAGDRRDEVAVRVPVVPFGVEMRAGRSGSTTDRAAFDLSLPENRDYGALQLLVEIGADPGRDLVAAALGAGFQLQNCRFAGATNLARSSQAIGALVVLAHLEKIGGGTAVDRAQLLGLAESTVAVLASRQLADGSFAWVGKTRQDVRSTCQIVRLLALARARGISGSAELLESAAESLQEALRTASPEVRADVLFALAAVDRARFESLNALHRSRNGLSIDGLARLAIAWQLILRPETAGEVLQALRQKLPAANLGQQSPETIALVARALLAGDRRDALGTAALAWLQEQRIGTGWGTPEATAAALQAIVLAEHTGAGAPRATKVTVVCNGKELQPASDRSELTMRCELPATEVKARGNHVDIRVEGGGQVYYRANLVGFARGFLPADRNDDRIRVSRTYYAAALRHEGKVVPAGFSVLDGKGIVRFDNKVTQLRVGDSCVVRMGFEVRKDDLRRVATPLIVEEPIPAGCSVPQSSIQGAFDHVLVQPDRLVFFFREGVGSGQVSYELQARFAGNYRVLPTFAHSALRPEVFAYSEPGALRVHARGTGQLDEYQLTPDEHYNLGSAWFAAGERAGGEVRAAAFAKAYEHLQLLLDGWQKKDHSLRDQPYREVARMMLFLGIERNDARTVVRFFEELKERYADLVIPFDKITAVGRSYLDLGEFEAALLVFRATAEASFVKDAAVATVLEQHGEVLASVDFLERMLREYPDLATMRVSRYSIGQKLAALAAALVPGQPIDPRKGTAQQLRRRAEQVLREFLVLYPEDPMAEEVSFAWATTQVEDQDLAGALGVSDAALQRYPGSTFTDEFLYTLGYAQFATGQHDAAFASLRRVAEEQFPLPTGGTGPSESQWHAVYLQGQIHHARGEAELALRDYLRVADRFGDAAEAAESFQQKTIAVPEVTTFSLTEAPQLQFSYRNIEKVAVQVYRVDLMRLYLMERSLQDIRGIQLHGIKPQLAFEVELGNGRDYRTIEKKVPLQLAEPGAYLIVVRGGDQLASGMLLRTDLRIEAREQFDNGHIRVDCRQGDACLADANVKISASGDAQVRSGKTDLRGVFVGENLIGSATVIVQKGDQYAFYRGTGVHQARLLEPAQQQVQVENKQQGGKAGKDARGFDAFDNNLNLNAGNRARQLEWLDKNVMNNPQRGVEVSRTK